MKAGERVRTVDIQLGKRPRITWNRCSGAGIRSRSKQVSRCARSLVPRAGWRPEKKVRIDRRRGGPSFGRHHPLQASRSRISSHPPPNGGTTRPIPRHRDQGRANRDRHGGAIELARVESVQSRSVRRRVLAIRRRESRSMRITGGSAAAACRLAARVNRDWVTTAARCESWN